MADDKQVDFVDGVTPVMAQWLDTSQEFQQGAAWNVAPQISGLNVVLSAGTLEKAVGLIIKGKMRYITSSASVSLSSASDGNHGIFAVTTANDDVTTFTLETHPVPTTPTSSTFFREIARVTKSSGSLTQITILAPYVKHASQHMAGGADALPPGSVTAAQIQDGTITKAKLASVLKPSDSAATTDEAVRALGTGTNNAYPGNLGNSLATRATALEGHFTSSVNPYIIQSIGPIPANGGIPGGLVINGGWHNVGGYLYGAPPSPVAGKTWRLRFTVTGQWYGNGNVGNVTVRIASDPVAGTGVVLTGGKSFGSGSEVYAFSSDYTTNSGRTLMQLGYMANQVGGGGGAVLLIHSVVLEGYVV